MRNMGTQAEACKYGLRETDYGRGPLYRMTTNVVVCKDEDERNADLCL